MSFFIVHNMIVHSMFMHAILPFGINDKSISVLSTVSKTFHLGSDNNINSFFEFFWWRQTSVLRLSASRADNYCFWFFSQVLCIYMRLNVFTRFETLMIFFTLLVQTLMMTHARRKLQHCPNLEYLVNLQQLALRKIILNLQMKMVQFNRHTQ